MPGPIDGVSPKNSYNDFEILDMPSPQEADLASVSKQPNAPVERNSFLDDFTEIDGAEVANDPKKALQGASADAPKVPKTLADKLRDAVPARRFGIKNFFTAIGRGFMNFCHAVRCVFTGGALWSRRSVDHVDFKATDLGRQLQALPPCNEKQIPFSGTGEEIGASLGLRGKITLKTFPEAPDELDGKRMTSEEKLNFRLYGSCDGQPKLSDIKQDPSRQDCWFLSSITAILRAKGPEAITRLIKPCSNGTHALVRLGTDIYKVPLGELRGDGGSTPSVSNSAPWVKLLETAMAMHLANRTDEGRGLDNGVGRIGLCALSGYDMSDALNPMSSPCKGEVVDANTNLDELMHGLKEKLDNGVPVLLGSPGRMTQSLSSGISPGHAVALMDVNADTKVCTVLDPYGRTRNVSFKDLIEFTVLTMPDQGEDKAEPDNVQRNVMEMKGKLKRVGEDELRFQASQRKAIEAMHSNMLKKADGDKSQLSDKPMVNTMFEIEGRTEAENKMLRLGLRDNNGNGNCFFYSALGGMKDSKVTQKASLELRKEVHDSTMKALEAAQKGEAKGLALKVSERTHEPVFTVKFTDVDGRPSTVNVSTAVNDHLSGFTLTDNFAMDPLEAAFLAHHLKRPVVVYSYADGVSLKQTFDYDLMTGEVFPKQEPDQGPLNIYFAGGEGQGHFQTIVEIND